MAKPTEFKQEILNTSVKEDTIEEENPIQQEVEILETQKTSTVQKEIKVIDKEERALLHQSFTDKTSAEDYVNDIGGDVLDEIMDLSSIDEDWAIRLSVIEENPSTESFSNFVDTVLHEYIKAINNLFEFTALAYALSSLGTFIKDNADKMSQDAAKVKKLVMLLEHLGSDLSSWREHIFILQDTADIHYLDSSFFSSCMQLEVIIGDKQVVADEENDDDLELF